MDINKDSHKNLNQSQKKKLLAALVSSLLGDLNEDEKKNLLREIVASGGDNLQVIDLVEHWIKDCTDSGVNPIEMSKEVMAAISYTYELASYSTPELRSLFNDWLTEIEQLMVDFVNERQQVDPARIAAHLHLQRSSVIFILSKLAKDGKINMQASGAVVKQDSGRKTSKIQPIRGAE